MNYITDTANAKENNVPCDKVIQHIHVETIPLCWECLFEMQDGRFICSQCKVNLCDNHVKQHCILNPLHEYILLIKQ